MPARAASKPEAADSPAEALKRGVGEVWIAASLLKRAIQPMEEWIVGLLRPWLGAYLCELVIAHSSQASAKPERTVRSIG